MHSKICFESSYPPLQVFVNTDLYDIESNYPNPFSQKYPFLLYVPVKRGNCMSGFPIISAIYHWANDFAGFKL